jgi:large exoprotein involved in heme utilization and adhesion
MADASITTEARAASGGDITIEADLLVDLLRSSITTSVSGGTGSGGNITIDPQFLILDQSRIIARADQGQGGNIRIVAGQLIRSPDSVIDASSNLGIDGIIAIDSPEVDIAEELQALPQAYLDLANELLPRCGARRARDGVGSFVVAGTAPLADSPDGPLAARPVPPESIERAGNPSATQSTTVLVRLTRDDSPVGLLIGCAHSAAVPET